MSLLDINDLHARVGDKEILKGISLTVNAGEVHADHGPERLGQEHARAGARGPSGVRGHRRLGHVRRQGSARMEPEERAQEGVFLAFQYPVEIPGVTNAYFLRAAYNEIRKARGEEEVDPLEFLDLMDEKLKLVDMDPAMLTRSVNAGFSGGEKKRNEILQMAVLEPKLAILDETDSGLDIDALRVVADGVNKLRRPDNATIVVTHYQRLLNYIVPDFVHVLADGRIVKSGGKELALELEASGYDWVTRRSSMRWQGRGRDRADDRRKPDRVVRRGVRHAVSARAGSGVAAVDPSRGDRALRRARLPDDAERRLALHQRRADRRAGVHAAHGARAATCSRAELARVRCSARPTGTRSCS